MADDECFSLSIPPNSSFELFQKNFTPKEFAIRTFAIVHPPFAHPQYALVVHLHRNLQRLALKGFSVIKTLAMLFNRFSVFKRAIALIGMPCIVGKLLMKIQHILITVGFC